MTEDAIPTEIGSWKLIGATDSTGKRLIVRCLACGEVKTIGRDALTSGGHVVCTNCQPARNLADRSERTSFAAEFASAESRSARKRHRGDDG